jgi:hypothetical protein
VLIGTSTDVDTFLRNLDYDAYHELTNEDHTINYTIETKAKMLSRKLQKSLLNSGVLNEDFWVREKTHRLDGIFRLCLTLKAKTVLTGKTYVIDMIRPGDTASNEMVHEEQSLALVENGQLNKSYVQLCLFPRIYSQTSSEHMTADSSHKIYDLVQPQNFVRRDGDFGRESPSCSIIAEALVCCV